MHRHDLPLCKCHVNRNTVLSPQQQIGRALDAYAQVLAQHTTLSAADMSEIFSLAKKWLLDMLLYNEEVEWMHGAHGDPFNEYHADYQMPRFRISFHLTVDR